MTFSIIAAVARDGAIGITRDGVPGLPWPTLRQDMAFFSGVTQSWDPLAYAQEWCTHGERGVILRSEYPNVLIAGRKTWQSLPSLPHRTVIVLTQQRGALPGNTHSFDEFEECLLEAEDFKAPHTFVIGGARVYRVALQHHACERLYLTEVDAAYPEADTHWPYDISLWNWELGACCDRGDLPWLERTACSAWIMEPERPRYRFTIYERA